MIRTANESDAAVLADIYNHYVLETIVTFETELVSAEAMGDRITETLSQTLPWLVAEDEDQSIIGYAYASKWKGRCAYRHSVEATVYLDRNRVSRGWGTKLYRALFDELERISMHAVIAGISLPNPASVALHEKLGMRKVAHFEEVGNKFDRWIDVGYWQKLLIDR